MLRCVADMDNSFIREVGIDSKEFPTIINDFQSISQPFDLDIKTMKNLEIMDKNEYIQDPCIATCCGMIFDFKNIQEAVVTCANA